MIFCGWTGLRSSLLAVGLYLCISGLLWFELNWSIGVFLGYERSKDTHLPGTQPAPCPSAALYFASVSTGNH